MVQLYQIVSVDLRRILKLWKRALMHFELKNKFDSLTEYFDDNGLDFNFKEIPYGIRFSILGGGVQINLYHGKRGFSFVVQGKDAEAKLQMQEELDLLFNGQSPVGSDPTLFSRHYDFAYMGSDESGKGDYFGPIVCVGVAIEPGQEKILTSVGVQDSKKLTDSRIEKMASKLFAIGKNHISVVQLNPFKYNQLYESFKSQGKGLNELLAWMHAKVIANLMAENLDLKMALVDQFANEKVMLTACHNSIKEYNFRLLQRTKAEENLAVAAASIIARDRLLTWHHTQKEKLGFELPRGAGNLTKQIAEKLIALKGIEALGEYCKLHFKTTSELKRSY